MKKIAALLLFPAGLIIIALMRSLMAAGDEELWFT